MDALGFLVWGASEIFGAVMLIADALAVVYICFDRTFLRRLYWIVYVAVVVFCLLTILFDITSNGRIQFWKIAVSTRIPGASPDPSSKYNGVSPYALMFFLVAPLIRGWRMDRRAARKRRKGLHSMTR